MTGSKWNVGDTKLGDASHPIVIYQGAKISCLIETSGDDLM
jgi:hypothetical protein